MYFWYWLTCNSAAVQSIAAAFGAVLAVITIVLLLVTLKAVRRQAKAAEDQAAARASTQVAKEQTRAAVDAAEAARKQVDLLLSQIEQSIAPLLVAEPDDRPDFKNYKVVNRGAGVAFQIIYWQGELDAAKEATKKGGGIPVNPVRPSTLGAGNHVYLPVPSAWPVITLRYKGADRAERWTVVYRDSIKDQQHWVTKGGKIISLT